MAVLSFASLAALASLQSGALPCDFSYFSGPDTLSPTLDSFAMHRRTLCGVRQGGIGGTRVHVLEFDPLTRAWSLSGEIQSPGLTSAHRFGESVDAFEDVIVVGRAGPTSIFMGQDNQSAEVYRRNPANGAWSSEALLRPPVMPASAELGHCVKVFGDTVVMQHRGFSSFGVADTGSVVVFDRDSNGTWNFTQRILPRAPTQGMRFGRTMELYEDRLIVGAPWDAGSTFSEGRVFIYERDSQGIWQLEFEMVRPSGPGSWKSFGNAVSIFGDLAVTVSSRDTDGRVYLLERGPNGWAHTETLPLDPRLASAPFVEAATIDMNPRRIAIGYDNTVGGPYEYRGIQATLFERTATGWSGPRDYLRERYLPSTSNRHSAMVAPDNTVVLGQRSNSSDGGRWIRIEREDANGNGSADVCEGLGQVYCTSTANSTGVVGALVLAGSEELVLDDVALQASSLPPNSFALGLGGADAGNLAVGSGTLCIDATATLGRFVDQVQSTGNAGTFTATVHLMDVPTAAGSVALMAGQTWRFQVWFRDGASSNLTTAVELSVR